MRLRFEKRDIYGARFVAASNRAQASSHHWKVRQEFAGVSNEETLVQSVFGFRADEFRDKARDYLSQLVNDHPQSMFRTEAEDDLKALGGAKPKEVKP